MEKKSVLTALFALITSLAFTQVQSQKFNLSDSEIDRLATYESRGHVSEKDAVITSTSTINWAKDQFSSKLTLDVEKAGIPMPGGKSSSVNRIYMELPALVKDPLLSVFVDDARTLGDIILEGNLTIDELTRIIDNAHKTPVYFKNGTSRLVAEHTIQMQQITSLLVKHHIPYTQKQPIDSVSSMAYTGIIIDARGKLPVHGEFIESEVLPCLFPKIWNDRMDLVYERNMVDPQTAKSKGIVHYSSSIYPEDYEDRVGKKPLWLNARKAYGINRTDPVLSYDDYLKIVSVKENLELLKKGKIVIILDEKNLVHEAAAPDKNKDYYIAYHRIQRYFFERKVPDSLVLEGPKGIIIVMNNLHFIADSPLLLPEEKERIQTIAESLKKVTADGEFTILVEGHTADVNKPEGQQTLSIQRAEEIINALVKEGVDKNLFSFKGYGGTKPVADNSTQEGRAQNRRVEITVMPKSTSVMRN